MPRRSVDLLMADLNFALERGMGPRDLVPMLEDLVRTAPARSKVSHYARLELGRQILVAAPFRSAALARTVAQEDPDSDEAYGLLGLALTLLGFFRAAAKAHRRACAIAPRHPGHAHNLGHLIDAALGRPDRALGWLERAFRAAPDVPGIASSYAHALVGVGRLQLARTILVSHGMLDAGSAEAQVDLWRAGPR